MLANPNASAGAAEGGRLVELFPPRPALGFCRVPRLVSCVCVFLLSCVAECGSPRVDSKPVMAGANNHYFCFTIRM